MRRGVLQSSSWRLLLSRSRAGRTEQPACLQIKNTPCAQAPKRTGIWSATNIAGLHIVIRLAPSIKQLDLRGSINSKCLLPWFAVMTASSTANHGKRHFELIEPRTLDGYSQAGNPYIKCVQLPLSTRAPAHGVSHVGTHASTPNYAPHPQHPTSLCQQWPRGVRISANRSHLIRRVGNIGLRPDVWTARKAHCIRLRLVMAQNFTVCV